jgi:plasmid stability protein
MLTSSIMPRTTLDLDSSVLRELRRRGAREEKSMGTVASELLAVALAESEEVGNPAPALRWISRNLGAPRVDLEDKEALRRVLDEES